MPKIGACHSSKRKGSRRFLSWSARNYCWPGLMPTSPTHRFCRRFASCSRYCSRHRPQLTPSALSFSLNQSASQRESFWCHVLQRVFSTDLHYAHRSCCATRAQFRPGFRPRGRRCLRRHRLRGGHSWTQISTCSSNLIASEFAPRPEAQRTR